MLKERFDIIFRELFFSRMQGPCGAIYKAWLVPLNYLSSPRFIYFIEKQAWNLINSVILSIFILMPTSYKYIMQYQ